MAESEIENQLSYEVRVALCKTYAAKYGWNKINLIEHENVVDDFLNKQEPRYVYFDSVRNVNQTRRYFDRGKYDFAPFFNNVSRAQPIFTLAAEIDRAPLEHAINERFVELATTVTDLQRTVVELQRDVKLLTLKLAAEKKE